MKGIMKIQLMNYLRQLQEIQATLAEEGVPSSVNVGIYTEDLWSLDFYVCNEDEPGLTTLYVYSPRLSTPKETYKNERKLDDLRNRYVKKALMVVSAV